MIMIKYILFRKINSLKAISLVAVLAVLAAGFVLAGMTGFNIMSGDQELLRMKNQTQGTTNWQDPVSANTGDQIRFLVYYHCGTNEPNWPEIKAFNTSVRLEFPTNQQTSIVTTARVSANNLSTISDTGTLNVTSAQKLTFSNTAAWHHDNIQQNVAVTIGDGYAQLNLGDIGCDCLNCYAKAGQIVFTAAVSSIFPTPTVDIKANGLDGPITIPYNTVVTLSWTSTNATSCTASGDWSGAKAISGSESTGNLTSNKTYTITCTGPGGTSNPDSVTVNVGAQPTLGLSISLYPSSGSAPLYDVDIIAAVSGSATGPITYSFDCFSDGGWELIQTTNNTAYTAMDLCDYISPGVYRVRVQTERGGLLISGTVNVVVGQTATFAVQLTTNPFYGTVPLNNVDLTVHVSGAASGTLIYRFDCTSDGSWEKVVTTDSASYTAVDLCNYAAPGNYTTKAQVERAGMRIEGTAGLVVLP